MDLNKPVLRDDDEALFNRRTVTAMDDFRSKYLSVEEKVPMIPGVRLVLINRIFEIPLLEENNIPSVSLIISAPYPRLPLGSCRLENYVIE